MRFTLIALLLMSCSASSEVYYSGKIVHIGGTLRQSESDPSQWCWIANYAHTPTGVDPLLCGTANNDKITFHYGTTYTKVITLDAGADDDYTKHLDMEIGASVGLSYSVLNVTSFGQPINVDEWLGYSYGNIWISGMMEK